jgi:farnesyl diphosphate synthase
MIPQQQAFLSQLSKVKALISPRLKQIIEGSTDHERLRQAMGHSSQGSGKFIRPFLVLTFAGLSDLEKGGRGVRADVIDAAVAVELVHSYSLVHDDLPAMDNAALRRGLPSCWKAFDEATAILVGDALIPLAYELLANLTVPPETRLALIREFSKAIGAKGLVEGQMRDLYSSSSVPDSIPDPVSDPVSEDIYQMQLLKTGALLSFSCLAGILLASGTQSPLVEPARQFGFTLGLIYQLTDDLLSEQGTSKVTGKPVHNDQDKRTFVSTLGVEGAITLLTQLVEETRLLTKQFDGQLEGDPLQPLLDFLKGRRF